MRTGRSCLPPCGLPALGLALLGLLGFGCEPSLNLDSALDGKACRAEAPYCLPNYECRQSDNVCVRIAASGDTQSLRSDAGVPPRSAVDSAAANSSATESSSVDTGAADTASAGAAGASPAGSPPAASDPAGSNAAGASGNGGAGSGDSSPPPPAPGTDPPPADGAAGAGSNDAGAAAGNGAADCTPVQLFRDRDGDGFGSDAEGDQKVDCLQPGSGWVAQDGDCLDSSSPPEFAARVHPGQTLFFQTGYPDASKLGGISFDYDCSLSEEPDPTNSLLAVAAPDCASLSLSACGGSGFLPAERSGNGINALCGSATLVVCQRRGGGCSALNTPVNPPLACR